MKGAESLGHEPELNLPIDETTISTSKLTLSATEQLLPYQHKFITRKMSLVALGSMLLEINLARYSNMADKYTAVLLGFGAPRDSQGSGP